ncbi:alpha-amylase family protein [Vibrio genomosp. F6]|uniref:Alpha-amylase n=1 Tax=Vibrio genomosp. F6 str. FF-238 TaxID=1191298 RepID=A0A1E5D6L3_9VIBR|nr:alpha-amylase family protein [Vibrio genomosp. F6]OEE79265.1 alpha-amylase [Vibrio genomosp. F6 str. FF-238]
MTHSVVPKQKSSDVILHAFDWTYSNIALQASTIHSLGYKSVLVSPPMKSARTAEGTKWWQRYQPQDYRIIDNQLGNTHDFKAMVDALKAQGIRTYVDVVFNHMANESKQRLDLQYPNAADMAEYEESNGRVEELKLFGDLSKPLFDEDDFVEAFGIENWKDKWEVQNGRISGGPQDPGLPTLRVSDYVVTQQQNYLKALKAMGVKGFRIDAAKHMSIEHLKRVWTEDITKDIHIFGEIITDGGATEEEYEIFLKPYLEETRLGAYDFPLFKTIHDAFAPKGSLKALIDPYCFGQALSHRRAITFTVTHDIPNNDVFLDLVMDEASEHLAYAYILGRDGGVPLVYTDLDTSGIVNSEGKPRWQDAWRSEAMMNMIGFHNQVHGEKMSVIEANDDMIVFSRGKKGLVVINKSVRSQSLLVPWGADVTDLMTSKTLENIGGKLSFDIPAKSCMMLVNS